MADMGLRAMIQSMLGGVTAQEDGVLINELARRMVLSGISVDANGVFSFSIPVFNVSLLTGTPSRLAGFDGSGNGTSLLLTNAYVDPAAAIAYSKLNLALSVVDADIAVAAAIAWSKISKTASSLADLSTRSASDLSSGTLPVARLGAGTTTVVLSTATGAQNNWAPGLVGDTVIFWSGASDIAITGFAGGVSGQRLAIRNTGAAVATVAHNSGSSSAGNKAFNAITSGVTPIAPLGFAAWMYDGTQWRLEDHDQGSVLTPSFVAGDYTASSGNWTLTSGDVGIDAYYTRRNQVTFFFRYALTTISATPTSLRKTIPNSWTFANEARNRIAAVDNGVVQNGCFVESQAAGTQYYLFFDAALGAFVAGTDNCSFSGSLTALLT